MKKSALLNQPISSVVAGMGHTDGLVIADAGLPIPNGPVRIDLALTAGVPGFLDTVETILSELQIEGAIVASEMQSASPEILARLQELMGDVPLLFVPHEEFKERTASAKAVIRTGEFSPYANVIFSAGVVF